MIVASKNTFIYTIFFLSSLQEKEAMEASVRAFEDWEFNFLERETGIVEEDESKCKERESEGELEKEISCQKLLVNVAQVNSASLREFFETVTQLLLEVLSGSRALFQCLLSHKFRISADMCCHTCANNKWMK